MSAKTGRTAHGGRIDRSKPLNFTFDGKPLQGFAGDTLASALLANGQVLVGRSFKYHRPRGIFSAGAEEPNALVTIGDGRTREPNIQATMIDLREGLAAESQNRWPSLSFDLQSMNGLLAPWLSAGFYYKTFMGPTRKAWMFYEHFIRKAAGLGRASLDRDPRHHTIRNLFADVAVVGAGPAGLSAARSAAQAGARVVLLEQDSLIGGQLLSEPLNGTGAKWLSNIEAELRDLPSLSVMTRSTAFGLYDGNVLGIVTAPASGHNGPCFSILHAKQIIFATGAIERPLVFPDNDRPGVMLASAIRTYLNRFGVVPGHQAVIATCNNSAYRTAIELASAGVSVIISDERGASNVAVPAGIEILAGARITGLRGRLAIKEVVIETASQRRVVAADLVGVSGGWSPTVHLTSHLGIKPRYSEAVDGFIPGGFARGHHGAGAMLGSYRTCDAIAEGHKAGTAAAAACGYGKTVASFDLFDGAEELASARAIAVTGRGKSFIDLQNDVTTADLELAHREGYSAIEHLKRYTTLGMGTDQGKTSNFAAIAMMSGLRQTLIAATGTTTFRPPFTAVSIGALAGPAKDKHYKPIRRTPMDSWHNANGAAMIEVGLWMRPWFYRSSGGDVNAAYVEEMNTVRSSAGLMDISTLGKIDVQGPDAATFLDRIYANGFAKLPVGRARYGIMLRDDGIVFDDGTATRTSTNHYFVTTSTSKAADVMSRMEFLLDTAWPELRVSVTSVTDEWAAMSIAGPKSRDILSASFVNLNVSNEALPHMGFVEGSYEGRRLRIIRLSYSGERAYEIYVGASAGESLWRHLLANGKVVGLKPYGVEALGALRVEKGHIAGPEIDGRTTLDDLGLGRMIGKRKGFVGSVLRHRPAFADANRERLVGLICMEKDKRLRGGAILFGPGDAIEGHGLGRITSVTYSPALENYVGLSLLAGGMEAEGTEVIAVYPMKNEFVRARVVSPVFLDPAGERMHG
jgi:sarcosine oxidase subunit alpha